MENKKSIAFFVPALYPQSTGGMEIFNYFLIKEIKKDYSCIYITEKPKKSDAHCVRLFSNLFVIKRFGFGKLSSFISLFFIFFKYRPQIVHIPYTSNFGFYAFWFTLLKKIYRFKIIVVNHGGGLKPWRNSKIQSGFFKNADFLVAVSSEIKTEYEKRTNRNDIKIIYPLVPFSPVNIDKSVLKEKWKLPIDSKAIIMVGSLKPLKGPDILIDAFAAFEKEFIKRENLFLVFAGEGLMKEKLKNSAEKYDLSDRILFLGNVPFEQIGEIYRMAHVYVIASWFEGLPKSLVGAMAYKTPVIGSNVSGIKEIVKHKKTGLIFEKNDFNDLSKCIQFALQNPNQMKMYRDCMHDIYLNEFSFKKTVDKFKKVYDSLL